MAYVGQSKAVGHRVFNHIGKSSDSITKDMITSLKEQNQGFVKTFLITEDILQQCAMPLHLFLDILEQFIILKYKPNLNKLVVIRHGAYSRKPKVTFIKQNIPILVHFTYIKPINQKIFLT